MIAIPVYFTWVRIAWTIIVPAILSFLTIWRITRMKKRNGSVLFKAKEIPYPAIIVVVILVIASAFMISPQSITRSAIVGILILGAYAIGYFERIVESLSKGIYQERIVYPGFTCTWDQIEGVIFQTDHIRFVHMEKGAFDFPMSITIVDQLKPRIFSYTTEIEQEKDNAS